MRISNNISKTITKNLKLIIGFYEFLIRCTVQNMVVYDTDNKTETKQL